MRTFTVFVQNPRARKPAMRRWLSYGKLSGPRALRAIERLTGRCMNVFAETSANGVTERLTLEQMKDAITEPAPTP
jgi:hypothetical protein